jgi:hypothetical protein
VYPLDSPIKKSKRKRKQLKPSGEICDDKKKRKKKKRLSNL